MCDEATHGGSMAIPSTQGEHRVRIISPLNALLPHRPNTTVRTFVYHPDMVLVQQISVSRRIIACGLQTIQATE
jgi:hypothetical protein